MKKTLIIAASILAIAGCKKAELITEQGQEDLITRKVSLAAEVAPESDDATVKSFFDTDDKYVKLTGAEELAVAYSNADPEKYHPEEDKPIVEGIVKGTSDGSSNYTFSHNAIKDATKYNYYFILPYRDTKNISTNSKKTGIYVKLDSIQHPTATSFDPLQDYIMGQPILDAEAQTNITAEKLKLKRLFALVRVTLSDGQQVLGGEALQKVSISFPAATDNEKDGFNHKKNNLINLCYLKFDRKFSNAGLSGYGDWGSTNKHASASVTAEYAEGLAAGEDGKYTVWYVTMPVAKEKNTKLTVVAQSKNKKVTRTIDLPSDMKLQAGIINDLKINITGDGYKVEDSADPNDYWSIYNAGQNITVNGQTINKKTHPGGILLQGEVTQTQLQQGGLLFLDTDVTMGYHYKPGTSTNPNTILIGRKKNAQPKLTVSGKYSIYFTKGNVVLKNLDITSGTATQLFVTNNEIGSDIDYAVIEDCNITASKHVYVFNDAKPVNAVKSISFDNCTINLTGTDNSYTVCRMGASNEEKITASGYAKFESVSINNCIIYAETVHTDVKKRRMLVDYGSNSNSVNDKKVRSNYLFPTENLNITVTNNTIVNLNANSNIFVRAYEANSANINKNVIYTDLTPAVGKYSVTYLFGLYNKLEEGTHDYKIRDNYSYVKRSTEDPNTGDAFKWKYTSAGPHDTYSVGDNIAVNNATELPITIGETPGYFPINTAVVTNGAGASYDTKPWVKVK